MKKSVVVALTAMTAALCLSIPASAETFTASNGVLSIELPNENWKEIPDPAKWIALSDGSNVLTIEHYSNGEDLPATAVADEHYENVYQTIYSTKNEVFVFTGSLTDAAKLQEMKDMIDSVQILQYDTKLAVQKQTVKASEFTIQELNQTMYVTASELNIRMGCSTEERILKELYYGDSVQVTGRVLRNGTDYGWYRVAFEGGTGYVSANFVTIETPSGTKVQCEYCGNWFTEGNEFRNHICPARDAAMGIEVTEDVTTAGEQVQCEYCGNWFTEGNEFRNHVCPARDAAMSEETGE